MLIIFLFNVVRYIHDLNESIWGRQILPHEIKIVQNIWLTLVTFVKADTNVIKAL